jgi:hypothetical protein
MKSSIAFSFDEVAKLSEELKFSVNDIIGIKPNKQRVYFDLHDISSESDLQRNFLSMFEDYRNLTESMSNASCSEIIISSEGIPLLLTTPYESLFKLFYCKWQHQSSDAPLNFVYSEISLSPSMNDVRKLFSEQNKKVGNTTLILGRDLFLSSIRKIQYYKKLLSITDDEINVLKNDLLTLTDTLEKAFQKKDNTFGKTCDIYVSFIDIPINSAYIKCDEQTISQYSIHGSYPIVIKNNNLCLQHKKWFDYLKKSSMLITSSNEIFQRQFLNRQRKYIELISEELSLY